MLDLAAQAGESGQAFVERCARDGLVSSLLLLHGIHPVPVERRVAEALERLRPRLRSSGGDVELVRATGEVIRVRLRGDASSGSRRGRATLLRSLRMNLIEVVILPVHISRKRNPAVRYF